MVDAEDAVGLAGAMDRLLFDHEAARQAAARGIRRSVLFHWEASAVALRTAYEEAIATHRARGSGPWRAG
jgi:glycosyltransferase involved in cell wall biosynthesis